MTAATLSPDSPMGEIMDAIPGARRALFSRYHLGGCQSCGFSNDETLAQLCARSGGIDADEALDYLLESQRHDEEMMISAADLQAALGSAQPPLLLDTRTREEHEAVSIAGSEFMDQALQQKLFGGDPEREIVLYDHTGRHVLDTCSWFQGHGMKNTRALRGGIDAWSREIDPKLPRYRLEID